MQTALLALLRFGSYHLHSVALINYLFVLFQLHACCYLSRIMRKPDFGICENKGAEQLRDNHAADQHLCFHYMYSRIPLLFSYAKTKVQNSCVIITQLISTFVFITCIVESLYFLKPKFQASSQSGLCLTWSETPKTRFLCDDAAHSVICCHFLLFFMSKYLALRHLCH